MFWFCGSCGKPGIKVEIKPQQYSLSHIKISTKGAKLYYCPSCDGPSIPLHGELEIVEETPNRKEDK